jgi:hypothetical protein
MTVMPPPFRIPSCPGAKVSDYCQRLIETARRERDLVGIAVQGDQPYFAYVLPRAGADRVCDIECTACAASGRLAVKAAFGRELTVDCPVCLGIGRLDAQYSNFAAGFEDALPADCRHIAPLHAAPAFDPSAAYIWINRARARAHLRRNAHA